MSDEDWGKTKLNERERQIEGGIPGSRQDVQTYIRTYQGIVYKEGIWIVLRSHQLGF